MQDSGHLCQHAFVLHARGHHLQVEGEGLQEPYHHGGKEDDGEGTTEEIAGLVPQEAHDVARHGHAVVGQFQHKGYRLATEH